MGKPKYYKGSDPDPHEIRSCGFETKRRYNWHLTKLLDGQNVIINPQCGLIFPIICKLLIGLGFNQILNKRRCP